jgi:iron complex outermembrane receptor protein
MSKNPKQLRPSLLSVSVSAALSAFALGGVAPGALAQEDSLEEVVITGSRIVRRDYNSNSPIVTVDSDQFEQQSGMNFESYLNQLPSFNPAAAPTVANGEGSNSDVQISAVRSVGIATVSLRGFGPNRNLVLVNGKRPTPINALMVTDINAVPSSMIQRVEVISGGASAVYGADAIGGVTNFILRDNFEGLEIDAQYGATEVGDGEESRVSAILGAGMADGRGNITVGMEKYERQSALEVERDFYTDSWSDPYVAGDMFVFGFNGYNTGFNVPNLNTLGTIFGDRPAGTGVLALGPGYASTLRFNADGSLFSLTGNNLYKYNGPIDGREYAIQRAYDTTTATQGVEIDTLKWNNTKALVSSPQERHSFFLSGTYDLTDTVSVYGRSTWAESKTKTLLLPTNASFGWEANIPFNPTTDSPIDPSLNYNDQAVVAAVLANPAAYANPNFIGTGLAGAQHPVPVEMAALLLSRPNPTGTWAAETYPADSFDQRSTVNTNTVWQMEVGANFELPFGDWTGEAYYSHGESSTYNSAFGNNSLSRWRALVTAADYGRNAELSGNQDGQQPGFGAADITCQTGFYDMLFGGDVAPSDDCKFAVGAPLQSRTQNQQDIIEINFQGGVIDLPAGEMRAAAGVQYRKNSAQFIPDILQSTASFTDQVIGVYPTAPMDATTSVKDYYGELLVPVIGGFDYLQNLELELGVRYSDYEHTDAETTFKALVNAQINDQVRLRGGMNRATRAPNLGELFLNRQEIFTIGGANFGDPCGLRSNATYGAGGVLPDPVLQPGEPQTQLAAGQTPEGALSTYLICQAQMGATGANTYYSQDAGGASGSVFNWLLQQGNPNLKSETADTWSFGAVVQSPWDNPWLAGLSGSFDWWKVDIEDAIQQYSVDYARHLCYGTRIVTNAAEAAEQAASAECQQVSRNQNTGGANTVLIAYDNQATIETAGIDVAINWAAQLNEIGFDVPGGIGLNVQASWLDYYRTKQSPTAFDVEVDWKGSLGPNLTGTNGGAYDYRVFTSLSYFYDNFSVSLRWRYMPEVQTAAYAAQKAVIANNAAVAAGAPGLILSYTPNTDIATSAYSLFDLSFNWDLNETITVRGGINNLLDEQPQLTSRSRGYPVGTDLSAVCDAAAEAMGCVDPTNYSLPNSGAGVTNGGYYDTLGRRFFVGVKARF